jgi:hypothetical protein
VDLVVSTAAAIVASIITSSVAVWLAMMRFRADKWWERKHDSYTRLLQVLHRLVRYAEAHLRAPMDGPMPEDEQERLKSEWKELSRVYAEVRDLADFDMSPEAVEVLKKYDTARSAARNDDDVDEWIRGDLAASARCLAEIKDAARRHLRVNQSKQSLLSAVQHLAKKCLPQ